MPNDNVEKAEKKKYLNVTCGFSMDRRFHAAFVKAAKERQLNSSAVVRKFIDDTLESWGVTKEEIYGKGGE